MRLLLIILSSSSEYDMPLQTQGMGTADNGDDPHSDPDDDADNAGDDTGSPYSA